MVTIPGVVTILGVVAIPPGDSELDPTRTRLIPFDDIPWDDLPSEAIGSMLRRYIDERRQDLFGIYVGDARSGEIQPLR